MACEQASTAPSCKQLEEGADQNARIRLFCPAIHSHEQYQSVTFEERIQLFSSVVILITTCMYAPCRVPWIALFKKNMPSDALKRS